MKSLEAFSPESRLPLQSSSGGGGVIESFQQRRDVSTVLLFRAHSEDWAEKGGPPRRPRHCPAGEAGGELGAAVPQPLVTGRQGGEGQAGQWGSA